ncbi:FTP domain-containing protein [Trichonephila clavipes]|nr:FTP domain-containing protein [Trichonephila clavipes]
MEKWKNGLMSVILLVMWFQWTVARDPTPKAYIRTSGKREKGLGIHRIPERIEVATCLARCQQTPSCVCVRISTTGSGICETFTNTSNPNILKTTGFAYYAADMYKKTLETRDEDGQEEPDSLRMDKIIPPGIQPSNKLEKHFLK